jgi:hypothetical protein
MQRIVQELITLTSKQTAPSGTFTFATDIRAEQHRSNFEAQLVHWEIRTQEAIRQANMPPRRPPIPDYATLQNEHLRRVDEARVAARMVVTEPQTPGLRTKARAMERRVYDEHIHEKQILIESLREQQRHEEKEQEKREILALRKQLDANVRAHPVPDWYHSQHGVEDDEIIILDG